MSTYTKDGIRIFSSKIEFAAAVKQRDHYQCVRCGAQTLVHAHHVKPIDEGGENSLENGISLCRSCHRGEHPLAGKAYAARRAGKLTCAFVIDSDVVFALAKRATDTGFSKSALVNRILAEYLLPIPNPLDAS